MSNYTVSFEGHYNTLVSALKKFRDAKKFHDVCFLAGSEKIYVNKTILAAYSPYMEQILNELNNTTVVFVAHGISANTMKQLIDFMYQGVISIPREDVIPLINAAKIYQIVGLVDCTLTHNEDPAVMATHHGQQSSYSSSLHPPQPYLDPALHKISPSSYSMSQLFPHRQSQPQPFEQTSAVGICTAHGCCTHVAGSTRVTITSTPAAPTTMPLARNTLLPSSRVTITPTSVVPAASSSASFECPTHCHLQRCRDATLVKSPPVITLEGNSEKDGDSEVSAILAPAVVHSSSSTADPTPSQSTITQITTVSEIAAPGVPGAPVTATQTIPSTCFAPQPSKRPHGNGSVTSQSPSANTSSPSKRLKRSCSPKRKWVHHKSPVPASSPVESKDKTAEPRAQVPDSMADFEELKADLKNISSGSSEDDDIIHKVLTYSDAPSPFPSSSSTKRTFRRGPTARRGHSFLCSNDIKRDLSPPDEDSRLPENDSTDESRTVSACMWSKFESTVTGEPASALRTQGSLRRGIRGRGRHRGRGRGRGRGRRPVPRRESSSQERRRSFRPIWFKW